jgi:hypothetical protein
MISAQTLRAYRAGKRFALFRIMPKQSGHANTAAELPREYAKFKNRPWNFHPKLRSVEHDPLKSWLRTQEGWQ